jgi:hypothetical protein
MSLGRRGLAVVILGAVLILAVRSMAPTPARTPTPAPPQPMPVQTHAEVAGGQVVCVTVEAEAVTSVAKHP